jgi:hypothetical protein
MGGFLRAAYSIAPLIRSETVSADTSPARVAAAAHPSAYVRFVVFVVLRDDCAPALSSDMMRPATVATSFQASDVVLERDKGDISPISDSSPSHTSRARVTVRPTVSGR